MLFSIANPNGATNCLSIQMENNMHENVYGFCGGFVHEYKTKCAEIHQYPLICTLKFVMFYVAVHLDLPKLSFVLPRLHRAVFTSLREVRTDCDILWCRPNVGDLN